MRARDLRQADQPEPYHGLAIRLLLVGMRCETAQEETAPPPGGTEAGEEMTRKHEPGMVTLDALKFHIEDLLDRFNHPELYRNVLPTTVAHFAERLIRQLEQCHAIEPADEILVLETYCAIDAQRPEAWKGADSLAEGALLVMLHYGMKAHRQIRKVARDDKPPDGAIWFVEALGEDGETVVVKRWLMGYFDSSD